MSKAKRSPGQQKNKHPQLTAINPKILFAPLMIMVGLVPLLVRMHVSQLSGAAASSWKENMVYDFFSWYKAVFIVLVTIGMLCILAYYLVERHPLPRGRYFQVFYIAAGIFVLVSLLSTLFSDYKSVAVWGAPERCEGMVITLCYVVMLIYSIYAFRKIEDFRWLFLPLCFVVAVNAFLGAFQFFGKDLFDTSIGKMLIIPGEFAAQRDNLRLLFEQGKIYGTMYHYNFMGSFGAMMVPLFLTLTLFWKNTNARIACGVMTLLSLFLLFGSTSRAGIVGLAAAVVCFLIIFGRKIVQHYKWTAAVAVVLVVCSVGINVVTGGLAFARIPTLVGDALALFTGGDEDFDYKAELPVTDIQTDGSQLTFVGHGDNITLAIAGDSVSFTDSQGQAITYQLAENTFRTTDPRYQDISFEMGKAIGGAKEITVLGYLHGGKNRFLVAMEPDNIRLIDSRFNTITYQEAERIGFEGQERLGSARGYIWSRSLPVFLDNLFLGAGPDTFYIAFPQNDLLGKWQAYDTPWMVVDKPHNMYLQMGINNGGLALLGFLVLVGAYLVGSFRRYALCREYDGGQALGAALALAVIGYLGAGFFNDTVVSVAPVFWVLLGTGIAVNHINGQRRRDDSADQAGK